MNNLKQQFNKTICKQLMQELGIKNIMAAPKLEKVSINVGTSRAVKGEQGFLDDVIRDLKLIAGQAPTKTQAKKAIAGFKIRENQDVGVTVTLRGQRMWDFAEKLIGVTIPRIKDFQGLNPKSFDRQGNLSIGIKEQLVFPEISPDDISTIFSLQVNVVNTAKTQEEGMKLCKALGFPIANK